MENQSILEYINNLSWADILATSSFERNYKSRISPLKYYEGEIILDMEGFPEYEN